MENGVTIESNALSIDMLFAKGNPSLLLRRKFKRSQGLPRSPIIMLKRKLRLSKSGTKRKTDSQASRRRTLPIQRMLKQLKLKPLSIKLKRISKHLKIL
jgi:hypothetical protein